MMNEEVMLVDTHAHLDMISEEEDKIKEIIDRALNKNVNGIISVGIDLKSSQMAVEFAQRFSNVFAAVGIHPNDTKNYSEQDIKQLETLAKKFEKVIAIGEIGLDYYRDYSPKNIQREAFCAQLELALALGLPVIIHARDSLDDCISMVKSFLSKGDLAGVFHCFSGNKKQAKKVLDLGFCISFTGVITFPKADKLREVADYVPIERILIETDCPFLSPVPFRGKKNEPSRVFFVAEALSKVKNIPFIEVARCTTQNAKDLFRLSNL